MKTPHQVNPEERRILDRYCANLEKQGKDKTGLGEIDPNTIISAIESISLGAKTISRIRMIDVINTSLSTEKEAHEALTKILVDSKKISETIQKEFLPTLEKLQSFYSKLPKQRSPRGPKINHAFSIAVDRLAKEFEIAHAMPVPEAVIYDSIKEETRSATADYICAVTESYFGPGDNRLNEFSFEKICNRLRQRRKSHLAGQRKNGHLQSEAE